ncbi:hypothetical protein ACEWY4_005205 [Coilia grayii]|uniref:Uncharacterized protein n=1 Tax=Coilia grayii TaxID=363190 RepID=A0ABD1KHN1_9TELE
MPSRKRIKTKTKKKSKSEDRSRIIEFVDDQSEEPTETDCRSLEENAETDVSGSANRKSKKSEDKKCSKEVHIAFLPDKYEPLKEETDIKVKSKEEELEKRRKKYKKFRKNVGKAVRFSWKCLVAGLQSFSAAYSTPLSAAATIIPDMHRAHPRG